MRKTLGIGILGFLMWGTACHKDPGRPVLAPPAKTPPAAPALSVPVPATWPELPLPPSRLSPPPEPPLPKDYRDGEANFLAGKYKEAAASYERFLRDDPTLRYKDRAMFMAGIAHVMACRTNDCVKRSKEHLTLLLTTFPQSPYSAESRLVLGMFEDVDRLRSESRAQEEKIKKLQDELEKLKEIDLKRRSPAIKK